MKPDRKISPPEWMTSAQAGMVMRALNNPGGRQTLFVGGCVRNELAGHPVSDTDLATIFKPEDVIKRLQRAGIRYAPTGIDHGTVTAITSGQIFEITTLRHDIETDGRHAKISFTDNWVEDAGRRDFTMNTLLADEEGNIYDPLGRGITDLEEGRVIFVGDPKERIAEDYLRILRFFRFHALYGRGTPDGEALGACRDAVSGMARLSRERITQEMLKILAVDDPGSTLAIMFENKIIPDFQGEYFDPQMFSRFCQLQVLHQAVNVMARLALLADLDYDRAVKLLLLSTAQKKTLRSFITVVRDVIAVSDKIIRRAVYEHERDVVKQMLILRMARDGESSEYMTAFQLAENWNPPKFPLVGQDVMDLGIKPGPVLGKVLSGVEAWWLAQDFAPDRSACLLQLQESARVLAQ